MLKKIRNAALAVGLSVATGAAQSAPSEPNIVWYNARELTIEGRGWTDTESVYDRLPARAKQIVNEQVWGLSHNSAGLLVRFVSDATQIHARWKLTSADLAMNHMPATGVSGVDLYVRLKGKWEWLAVGRPTGQNNETLLTPNIDKGTYEYTLYFPLYNGVTSVEVGVPSGSFVKPAPPRKNDIKPVVFYGTSITQGGCASRPGMAYTAIVGRKLDIPVINLGFSGSGRGEPEIFDLIAELDASLFVIDPMANMRGDWVEERIGYALKTIKAKRPGVPVMLVEHAVVADAFRRSKGPKMADTWNVPLRKVYEDNVRDWDGLLYYVKCDKLTGKDGEHTVDGVHCTDVGFLRMADVLTPAVKKALEK